jgi:hypothetical protein
VLSIHQGGGEPLRPMPLEITRYLHVSGAELSPPPPVRRGAGRVMVVDTPWPNGQACHSCGRRRLVSASDCQRQRPPWALPSARPRALRALPRLRPPVEGEDSPF